MTGTYKLFLDDYRYPEDCTNYMHRAVYNDAEPWIVVKDYQGFVFTIEQMHKDGQWPKLISFDHDLADVHYIPEKDWDVWDMQTSDDSAKYYKALEHGNVSEYTGYHCAEWLIKYVKEHNLSMPAFLIHSMNPVGARNIKALFNKHDYYGS